MWAVADVFAAMFVVMLPKAAPAAATITAGSETVAADLSVLVVEQFEPGCRVGTRARITALVEAVAVA